MALCDAVDSARIYKFEPFNRQTYLVTNGLFQNNNNFQCNVKDELEQNLFCIDLNIGECIVSTVSAVGTALLLFLKTL